MRRDQGSVTAEMAVALPGLVLVLAAALWAVTAAGAKVECIDAARAAARAAARGEPLPAVRAAAVKAAPAGAHVALHRDDDLVEVEVSARVRVVGAAVWGMPAVVVHGHVTAAVEPS